MASTMPPTTDALDALGGLSQPVVADPRVTWRPSPPGAAARIGALVALVVVLVGVPHWLPEKFVPVAVLAVTYSVIGLSLNVLMGYAGQVSLGHAAFVGVGAFAGGIVLTDFGMPYPVALLASIALGALLALVLGAIALRVAGLNLAIVTISFGLVAQESLFNIRSITGGGAGKLTPRPGFAQGDIAYIYFCMLVLVAVWAFDWRLTSTKAGRAIQALRDDERVAASWGINVTAYKLLAFVITGGLAGLGGLLFAGKEEVATPQSFLFITSLTFLLMTVVGGLRSRPGVVIGGAFFAVLPTLLEVAHTAWGIDREFGEGMIAPCATAPPRILQAVIGLAIIGAAVEVFAHRRGSPRRRLALGLVGVLVLALGAGFALAGFNGGFCLFEKMDTQAESLIGAMLLLITLIQFPGGIAQQFAPVFRWLSFQRFHAPESVSVAGGAGGGAGGSARP